MWEFIPVAIQKDASSELPGLKLPRKRISQQEMRRLSSAGDAVAATTWDPWDTIQAVYRRYSRIELRVHVKSIAFVVF